MLMTGGDRATENVRCGVVRIRARQGSNPNTSDPTVMKRAIDMTDDELAAIASGATLHVVK